MVEKMAISSPTPPSLQGLCENKALSHILDSDFTDSQFSSLEPRLQQILFRKLRTETARLKAVEKDWCRLMKCCPRLDTQIHLVSTRIEPSDSKDDETNGYNQIRRFNCKWSYTDESIGEYVSRTTEDIERIDEI